MLATPPVTARPATPPGHAADLAAHDADPVPPRATRTTDDSAAKPRTLDTIFVQGRRIADAADLANIPGAVSSVDGDSFGTRAVHNIADALRDVPGVFAASTSGGDDSFLSIRGSNLNAMGYANSGVDLFENGLPVTTADGNNHNRIPDPLNAERVIVARGANALSYGASTLGGAIDFISRTARNSQPDQLSLRAGSHGLATARLSLGGVSGALDGMFTVEGKHWGGYRAHSRERRHGFNGNLGWAVSERLHLRLYASHTHNDQQLPGELTRAQYDADPWQADPSYLRGNHQLNVETNRVAATGRFDIDAHQSLSFGVSWENQMLFHPIVDVFVGTPPVDVFSLLIDTHQRTTGAMLRYHLDAGDHDVLAGINLAGTTDRGGNYQNDAGRHGALSQTVDNSARSVKLFVLDHWHFAPRWTLVYGAQGVRTGSEVRLVDAGSGALDNPQGHYSSINPRAGLVYTFADGSQAYASVSRLYEVPTTFDLSSNLVGGADASLAAMHGVVSEIGLRGSTPRSPDAPSWQWDASLYHARIHGEILSVDDPDAPGISLTSNIPRTTHAGIEVAASASFPFARGSRRIEPRISATYNDFHFDDDADYGHNRLPAAPRYALHGEALYRDGNGFFIGPTFDLVGARYADFSNAYRVGTYHLLGLRAGITHARWELFGQVTNLLDQRYVSTVAVMNQAGAGDAVLDPGAPRSFYAGLRIGF